MSGPARVEDLPSATTERGDLGRWLGGIGAAVAAWPARYRRALARDRRRTLLLTALVAIVLIYPLLNHFVLASFSRNVFSLPLPTDTIMVFMAIFALMAIGLNVVIGYAGLLDLGYVAFYAIGAYVAAFLASPHWNGISFVLFSNVAPGFPGIHIPFWFIVPLAAVVAAFWGALLGAPTLRLRGDYLAIVTLGFGEIVPVIFKNLNDVSLTLGPIRIENANLTGGPLGINPIDAPRLFGIRFGAGDQLAPVYLAIAFVIIAIVVSKNLERSRMGRAWKAIREDEVAAELMGVNTVRTKLLAFALGASFAGVAGAMQASYQGATTSDFFQFAISIQVVIMVILGGLGNVYGVIAGALALVYVDKVFLGWLGQRMQELGRTLENEALQQFNPASLNFLIFGITLVAMMRFRPEGFLPSRQRAAELHEAPPGQAMGGTVAALEAEPPPDVVEAVEDALESPAAADDTPDRPNPDPLTDPMTGRASDEGQR